MIRFPSGLSVRALQIQRSESMRNFHLTLVIDENLNLSMLHHTNAAVCGTQIDTNDGAIVLRVRLRVDALDNGGGEESKEESEQSKAEGHVASRSASHCVKSFR